MALRSWAEAEKTFRNFPEELPRKAGPFSIFDAAPKQSVISYFYDYDTGGMCRVLLDYSREAGSRLLKSISVFDFRGKVFRVERDRISGTFPLEKYIGADAVWGREDDESDQILLREFKLSTREGVVKYSPFEGGLRRVVAPRAYGAELRFPEVVSKGEEIAGVRTSWRASYSCALDEIDGYAKLQILRDSLHRAR